MPVPQSRFGHFSIEQIWFGLFVRGHLQYVMPWGPSGFPDFFDFQSGLDPSSDDTEIRPLHIGLRK
jgi:hypothetical protein